ncbi:MAG: serpin family protein, partial [Anaerolineae bacterium]
MSVADLVAANNQFGFDLLASLTADTPEKNVFISPASMALALSMTANGADDPTSQAMLNLLRLAELDWTAVNQSHAALWQALDGVDPQVTLSMANSLWAEMGFPFKAAFRDAVRSYYEAGITNLDFGDTETAAQTINQWVEDKTQSKIKNLLSPGDLVTAVLVLVNAIYFKGEWAATFDKAQTKDGDFYLADKTTKTMPMMSREGEYHYQETADYQLISLPFGQGQLSFIVFLPAPDKTLVQAQPILTASNWTEAVGRLIPRSSRPEEGWQPGLAEFGRQKGTIILPRFKVEYGKSLLEYLV